jgi:hypothetical protein
VSSERAQDADVSEAARSPAAECETDGRPHDGTRLLDGFNAAIAIAWSPPKGLEHHDDLRSGMIEEQRHAYKRVMWIW